LTDDAKYEEEIEAGFTLGCQKRKIFRDPEVARDESNQKHVHTAFLINAINKKIDAVPTDLADHRADAEGHKKAYRVR
jgi:hypothetical protein